MRCATAALGTASISSRCVTPQPQPQSQPKRARQRRSGGAVETARAAAIAAAPPVIAAAGTSEAAANDSAKVRQPGRRRSVTPIVVGLGSFFDRGTVLLVIARECCLLPSLIRMMHWEMPLTSSRCTRRRVEKTGELVRRRDGELYVDAYGRMRRFHNSIMNERNTEPVRAAAVHGR